MRDETQHVLICYGGKLGYYHGAKYQIIRNFTWYRQSRICVVTDKPELFDNYPVRIIPLNETEMRRWSLGGANHFGIKIIGLFEAIETADSVIQKSILLDTDMFWKSDPIKIADKINESTIVFYEDEGPVFGSTNKSIQHYDRALSKKSINYGIGRYELTSHSHMWRSSLIGIHHSRKQLLTDAFELFKALNPLVSAHTIEQFALGEIARLQKLKIEHAKKLLNDWSSIGRKNYATPVLEEFFIQNGETDFFRHLAKFQTIKISRPLTTLLKQKIDRFFSK